MSHLGVQLVVGRLLTDEQFRQRFEQRRHECLLSVRDGGVDLDDDEMAALMDVDPAVWARMASRIDHRLQHGSQSTALPALRRPLTVREHQVLRGVFEGLTNKQIGVDVGVSEAAVKATLQHLFRKTQVRTRAQLVRVALENAFGGARPGRR
jgi:DNA-binding NarL/FixJ family response regulator